MNKDIRIILAELPVQPLLDAIDAAWWDDITIRQSYPGSHHRDTHCIFLRGPKSFLHFFDTTATDYPRLAVLMPVLMPVLAPLLNTLQCPPDAVGRVLLVKLRAHGHVQTHTDTGPYADAFTRHHVVLSSNEFCSYRCGESEECPPPGTAFWFDHHKPHSATNNGPTDRIHLIVDTLAQRQCDPSINWSDLCPKD